MSALEVIACPLSDGQICAPIAKVQQREWELNHEIKALAGDVRENTSAVTRALEETRELRVAVGVQTRMLAERIDPILEDMRGRDTPTDAPREKFDTLDFPLEAQERIVKARDSMRVAQISAALAKRQRNLAIPFAALAGAAITAITSTGLLPAIFRAIAHLLGG